MNSGKEGQTASGPHQEADNDDQSQSKNECTRQSIPSQTEHLHAVQLRKWISGFIKNQYQRTSIPVLIISFFTFCVATTGLIFTILNYHHQQIIQAENLKKEELRNALWRYYTDSTDLIEEDTHLPLNISQDDLARHTKKASEWMERVYLWTRHNLGNAAADTLTERQQTMGYGAAHGSRELNNLLNSLFSFGNNIKGLINSNMWNSMQK